jgi:hypothetical protein
VCAEIGKECTDYDPRRRPDAGAIVRRLDDADIDMTNLSTQVVSLLLYDDFVI